MNLSRRVQYTAERTSSFLPILPQAQSARQLIKDDQDSLLFDSKLRSADLQMLQEARNDTEDGKSLQSVDDAKNRRMLDFH